VRSGIFIGVSSFGGGIPHRRGYEIIEESTKLEERLERKPGRGNDRYRTGLWGDHPIWNVERSVMRLPD
jgi:hypothetical protein